MAKFTTLIPLSLKFLKNSHPRLIFWRYLLSILLNWNLLKNVSVVLWKLSGYVAVVTHESYLPSKLPFSVGICIFVTKYQLLSTAYHTKKTYFFLLVLIWLLHTQLSLFLSDHHSSVYREMYNNLSNVGDYKQGMDEHRMYWTLITHNYK
jgi:hypothetical protein